MMKLKIISPEKIIFESKVSKVNLPGKEGAFQVFKDHAPIISFLDEGDIEAFDDSEELLKLKIKDGIVKLENNNILILL